ALLVSSQQTLSQSLFVLQSARRLGTLLGHTVGTRTLARGLCYLHALYLALQSRPLVVATIQKAGDAGAGNPIPVLPDRAIVVPVVAAYVAVPLLTGDASMDHRSCAGASIANLAHRAGWSAASVRTDRPRKVKSWFGFRLGLRFPRWMKQSREETSPFGLDGALRIDDSRFMNWARDFGLARSIARSRGEV